MQKKGGKQIDVRVFHSKIYLKATKGFLSFQTFTGYNYKQNHYFKFFFRENNDKTKQNVYFLSKKTQVSIFGVIFSFIFKVFTSNIFSLKNTRIKRTCVFIYLKNV